MKLVRLAFDQHPRPPPARTAPEGVFDSGGSLIGYVAIVYVDDGGNYRFVDVATGGVMGWLAKKHRLLPVEAVAAGEPGSITLRRGVRVGQRRCALYGGPIYRNEELQRDARERCGFGAVPPDP